MPFAGIDVGSMTAEAVIIDNGALINYAICPTGANSKAAARKVLEKALGGTGLSRSGLLYIIATGYGRINVDFADKQVTEITCHGVGAYFRDNSVRTVIDIGGQDSKVIRLDDRGRVTDFVMNDKCAAGTGRFLEVMSRALEVELDQLAFLSSSSSNLLSISSMCTVFAESEVVSLIAQGQPREDIARGLHQAIAERTAGLIGRVGFVERAMMTGGVALNSAVVQALGEKLNTQLIVPREPQITGAMGAALLAEKEYKAAK